MTEPASWLVVERGWKAYLADGSEAGTVEDVAGDRTADIFDGLAVKASRLGGGARYVPSERVGRIEPDAVHLTLTAAEFEQLGPYDRPAVSERILPESASLGERLAGAMRRLLGGR
jgi:hypothetical protein